MQIEIRQDLLSGESKVDQWVKRLDQAFAPLLDDVAMLAVEHH